MSSFVPGKMILRYAKYKFVLEQTTANCTAWTWTSDENMDFQVKSIPIELLVQ